MTTTCSRIQLSRLFDEWNSSGSPLVGTAAATHLWVYRLEIPDESKVDSSIDVKWALVYYNKAGTAFYYSSSPEDTPLWTTNPHILSTNKLRQILRNLDLEFLPLSLPQFMRNHIREDEVPPIPPGISSHHGSMVSTSWTPWFTSRQDPAPQDAKPRPITEADVKVGARFRDDNGTGDVFAIVGDDPHLLVSLNGAKAFVWHAGIRGFAKSRNDCNARIITDDHGAKDDQPLETRVAKVEGEVVSAVLAIDGDRVSNSARHDELHAYLSRNSDRISKVEGVLARICPEADDQTGGKGRTLVQIDEELTQICASMSLAHERIDNLSAKLERLIAAHVPPITPVRNDAAATNDGGPAFPLPFNFNSDGMVHYSEECGMSLRDYLAAKAMQAMRSIWTNDGDVYDPGHSPSDFAPDPNGDWWQRKDTGRFWRSNTSSVDRTTHAGPFTVVTTYEQRIAREAYKQADAMIAARAIGE